MVMVLVVKDIDRFGVGQEVLSNSSQLRAGAEQKHHELVEAHRGRLTAHGGLSKGL